MASEASAEELELCEQLEEMWTISGTENDSVARTMRKLRVFLREKENREGRKRERSAHGGEEEERKKRPKRGSSV